MKKNYRILSLDGGGIRGVYTATLLALLEENLPFLDQVDLIAGTSTGACIAISLASGFAPKDIIGLYLQHGKDIFIPEPSRNERRPKYTNQGLLRLLDTVFPHKPSLADLQKTVVIPTFSLFEESLGSWGPVIFDNFDKEEAKKHLASDIALRSGASPGYFPSYQGYIDGGVFANNPSMIALTNALDPKKGNQPISSLSLLSLGTGKNLEYIQENVEWGATAWTDSQIKTASGQPLLNIISDGSLLMPHEQCMQLLKGQYKRVNPALSKVVQMDEVDQASFLLESAQNYPQQHPKEWDALLNWVREHFVV